jgi:hypothetical protein
MGVDAGTGAWDGACYAVYCRNALHAITVGVMNTHGTADRATTS